MPSIKAHIKETCPSLQVTEDFPEEVALKISPEGNTEVSQARIERWGEVTEYANEEAAGPV